MVRQRERKVLRAVKAARASRHPNKYFLQNQMRFPKRGPFVRGVCWRAQRRRARLTATCFRALRRLTNVEKAIQNKEKVFVVPFSAACAAAQTIRCSRSHRLKRAREVLQQINHVLYANAQPERDYVSTFAAQKRFNLKQSAPSPSALLSSSDRAALLVSHGRQSVVWQPPRLIVPAA
jgi:hypothetical protein